MATSKAKRPILLAQPKPQRRSTIPEQILRPKYGLRISPAGSDARKAAQPNPTGLLPVKANIYRAIAELNSGFQTVIHELQVLGQVGFLRSHGVTEMRELLCRVRAQANRDFTMAMHEREKMNADILAGAP